LICSKQLKRRYAQDSRLPQASPFKAVLGVARHRQAYCALLS